MGLHPAQAAHALRALLRRRGVGDARGVGAALLRQRAGGKSGERRGPPAGRQHRLSHGVGDLPRVPRLLPPHRRPGPGGRDGELPGLLPGAVGARPHPLRHAARGRLGRHAAALGLRDSHSPHHRRAGLQGRAVLRHGWAELHLPALRSSQQPRAGRGGLQPRGARQLDLVLGLHRHVPGRNDAAHAQRPLRDGRPAGRKRSKTELAARDVPREVTGSPTPRR